MNLERPLSALVCAVALGACVPALPPFDTAEQDHDGDGWSLADGDCDDRDAGISPGADELCDGVDNDCDGAVDYQDMASVAVRLTGEAAGDLAGSALAGVGDVDAAGFDDVLVGAYGNGRGAVEAGVAFLVRGPITTRLDLSSADAVLVGENQGDWAGFAVLNIQSQRRGRQRPRRYEPCRHHRRR